MQFSSCSSRVTLSSAAAALATNGGGSCKGHCLLQRDNETARWQYKRDRERERGERRPQTGDTTDKHVASFGTDQASVPVSMTGAQ